MPTPAAGMATEAVGQLRSAGKSVAARRQKLCCGHGHEFDSDSDESPDASELNFPKEVCSQLQRALALRAEYVGRAVAGSSRAEVEVGPCPVAVADALVEVLRICSDARVAQICRSRLDWLSARYDLYSLELRDVELREIRMDTCGLYSIPQVDTHLHASAIMTAPQLMRFVDDTYKKDKDRSLGEGKGTVGELMRGSGYNPAAGLDVDSLGVQASHLMFQNFSEFNAAFSPLSSRAMKGLFFGTDHLDGEYLFRIVEASAAISRENMQYPEPRFSIYGRAADEWSKLAAWARRWKVPEIPSVLFGVQLPRIYPLWRKKGFIASFGDMLRNFWSPLLQAAVHPEAAEHQDVAWLLGFLRVVDTVDDESKMDEFKIAGLPSPDEWTSEDNPPYAYYHYYMYANLTRLNALRAAAVTPAAGDASAEKAEKKESAPEAKEVSCIPLRPHCGEAGPTHHLVTAWLFCAGISHGIQLDFEPVLQYLYYLAQVPIGVSPMSNAVLFRQYTDNPFPRFFKRGLCVALTTDDPMMFHTTPTPLLEEYSMARTVFGLSAVDLAEISRNSCRAAFSPAERKQLHGDDDPGRTNIPRCRYKFRADVLDHELANVCAQ